jgi:hypothetical protein
MIVRWQTQMLVPANAFPGFGAYNILVNLSGSDKAALLWLCKVKKLAVRYHCL